MTRKKLPLAIAALTAGMFGSSVTYALGLGDIKLYSHLNEPLQAEIELVQVGDLNADEIITKLASKEAFDKAGIDRDFFLTQIKFEVVFKPNGVGVLKLSTSNPAKEPFLDLILDTSWSNGHVLKQYTLLLDPETYTPEGASPSVSKSEPEPEQKLSPVAEQNLEPAATNANTTANQTPAAQAAPVIPAGTEHYTTQKNDTLWRIANAHQTSGASVYQTMDAIQKLNSDAFIKNNRNLLKTDKALRLPSPEEVTYLSQGGSVNQLLADQRRAAQSPQLSTDQTAAPTQQTSADDKLKIVGSSKTTDGAASSNASSAGTSESIDKIDRDNQDLNLRLAELTSQIKTMQQLIQMQDQQLTTLQQQLGGGTPQKAEMKQAVEKLKSELSKVETEVNKEPTAIASSPIPATSPTTTTSATTATIIPASATATTAEPSGAITPTAQPTVAPVATQPPVAAKPVEQKQTQSKPVEAAAPAEQESSSSWVVVLVGILLGLAAAGAAFGKKFIDKRKAQQKSEAESDWSVDALRNEPSLASMIETPEEEKTEVEQPTLTPWVPTSTSAASQHVATDPLETANSLADQGNLSDAVNVLKEAISEHATRLDLRTRLLELSVDVGDVATFEAQESYISRWGGAAAKQRAKELREVINTMPESSSPTEVITPAMDTTLDFDIDTTATVETPVIEKTADDELISLDHLFDDAPTTSQESVNVNTEETSPISDDLAVLDHLFDEAASVEAVAPPIVEDKVEKPTVAISDDLNALDHLFDDAPSPAKTDDSIELDLSDFEAKMDETEIKLEEPPASSEIDFAAELGLLDLDEEATTTVSSSVAPTALTESPAPIAEVEPAAIETVPAPIQEQTAIPTTALGGDDEEFSFLAGADEAATKLDLAKAYIDMEDIEGAKDILQEVLQEGNAAQQQEAKDLLAKL